MTFFRSLYIHNIFFRYIAVLSACFVVSYWVPNLYPIAWLLAYLLLALFILDLYLLYASTNAIKAHRNLPQKLSNSDQNILSVHLSSKYPFKAEVSIIDELPVQFQKGILNIGLNCRKENPIILNIPCGLWNVANMFLAI